MLRRAGGSHETRHRQQELFVLVDAAVDRAQGRRIPFDEEVISLYVDGSKEQILQHSPAGKVPVLIDGDVHVWESLAILEYAAEKFPDAGLWPSGPKARAHARAISTEMHAASRRCATNAAWSCGGPPAKKALSADALANIARVQAIWTDCRARFGVGGPFLFGAFTAADAMYAPVVSRFQTYAIDVSPSVQAYMATMIASPAWQAWRGAALRETIIIPRFEENYPDVPRIPANAA